VRLSRHFGALVRAFDLVSVLKCWADFDCPSGTDFGFRIARCGALFDSESLPSAPTARTMKAQAGVRNADIGLGTDAHTFKALKGRTTQVRASSSSPLQGSAFHRVQDPGLRPRCGLRPGLP
jgi:hypothetical protein